MSIIVPTQALLGSTSGLSASRLLGGSTLPAPVITGVTPGTDGGNPVLTFDSILKIIGLQRRTVPFLTQ